MEEVFRIDGGMDDLIKLLERYARSEHPQDYVAIEEKPNYTGGPDEVWYHAPLEKDYSTARIVFEILDRFPESPEVTVKYSDDPEIVAYAKELLTTIFGEPSLATVPTHYEAKGETLTVKATPAELLYQLECYSFDSHGFVTEIEERPAYTNLREGGSLVRDPRSLEWWYQIPHSVTLPYSWKIGFHGKRTKPDEIDLTIDVICATVLENPPGLEDEPAVAEYFQNLLTALRNQNVKPENLPSCFISYSSGDQEFAERLHADLEAKDVPCWFAPEHMKIGDKIRPTLDQSVRAHDKLLIILSENSVGSNWVEQEVETALARERKEKRTVLFPIRLDDAIREIDVGWPALIRNTRHIGDFCDWKDHDAYQRAFRRLLRDLKAGS